MDMKLPRSIASVEEVYGSMNVSQTREFLRLCAERGYQSDINAMSTCHVNPLVDQWFDKATEGERNHMANKLIKHGYPEKGINSKAHIEYEALAEGYQTGYEEGIDGLTLADKMGVHSLPYILKTLRRHKYTLADIVVAWSAP